MAGEAVNVADVESVLRLKDEFSDVFQKFLGMAPDLGESMKAIGEAAALMGTAIAAGIGAIGALGTNGGQIDDVRQNFDRLAGSSANADAILTAMRTGVKGTVDDMTLMTDATKLISSGMDANASDFGTMTSAAVILSKEGYGSTTDMLGQLSVAMETGRMRGEALRSLHVDLVGAEQAYQAAVYQTGQKMDAATKSEVDRAAIEDRLKQLVSDSGEQQLSFGQKVEQSKANIDNFVEAIEVAVATSPVVNTAMDAIAGAINDAFGGSQISLVQQITGYVNSFAIVVIDVGIGATQVATVMVTVWGVIKVSILAVLTTIGDLMTGFARIVAVAADLATRVPIVGHSFDGLAGSTAAFTLAAADTTNGLRAQMVEAADMVTGHSTLNTTIDNVAGGMLNLRDKMIVASAAGSDQKAVVDALAASHAKIPPLTAAEAQAYRDLASVGTTWKDTLDTIDGSVVQAMNDYLKAGVSIKTLAVVYSDLTQAQLNAVDKGYKVEQQAMLDNAKLSDQLAATLIKNSGTATDAQIANAAKVSADMTAARQKAGTDDAAYYTLRTQLDQQSTDAIMTDHTRIAATSIEALQQEATKQQNTLNDMMTGDLHYTQQAIANQQAIVQAANDKARGLVAATNTVNAAQQGTTDLVNSLDLMFVNVGKDGVATFQSVADAVDAMNDGLSAAKINVVSLDGSVTSLANAIKKLDQGSSQTYDLSTEAGIAVFEKANPGATISWSDDQIMKYIAGGGTLQQLVEAGVVNVYGKLAESMGQSVGSQGMPPGFAGGVTNFIGGLAIVGEQGPELLDLPQGTSVYPNAAIPMAAADGMDGGGSSGAVQVTTNLVLNGTVIATAVNNYNSQQLRSRRLMPAR